MQQLGPWQLLGNPAGYVPQSCVRSSSIFLHKLGMPRPSSIPHIVACLRGGRNAPSLQSLSYVKTESGSLRIGRSAPASCRRRYASSQRTPLPKPRYQPQAAPPEPEYLPNEPSTKRSGKGYLWAVSIFGVALGIYAVSFGISFRNARQKNKELDIAQNADVSYRWTDAKRNFDHEVDNAESFMLMRAKRRRLINEAYGNVLEVSVGTGRNFELYDLRPYDSDEDAKFGRSRTRIITHLTFNDQSEVMVDQAMTKYLAMERRRKEDERFTGDVRFIVGDAGHDGVIDRPSGGFDTIVQTFGVCSMADPVGFLRKLGQLCRQPGESTTSKLPEAENDGKGGRILLLEHGRGHYGWLNNILDSVAKVHALHFGCWWNKDIAQVIADSGLEVERIKRYNGGTTWEIVLRPKGSK